MSLNLNQLQFKILFKMLIKNIQVVDKYKQFKHAIFRFARQIHGVFDYSSFGLIHLFLIHFLLQFPLCSVLFKKMDYFPTLISQVFRFLLFTNFRIAFSLDWSIIYAIGIALQTVIICGVVAHFLFGNIFKIVTKYLGFSIKFLHYFIVSQIDFIVVCYKQMTNFSDGTTLTLLAAINLALSIPFVIIILVYVKFELRLMRKKNIIWNLDNDVHLYGTFYLIFKTFVIAYSDNSVSLCLLSLGVWFYHRQYTGGCIGRREKVIEYSIYNYIAAADLSVLVYLVYNDTRWALGTWIVLVSCEIIYCLVTLYRQRVDKIYLPDCDSGPEQFYNYYYSYRQSFKGNGNFKAQYELIYYLHKMACKSHNCNLSLMLDKNSFNDLEQMITKIIQTKKNDSMNNRIVCELWNLQMGKKCSIEALTDKRIDFRQEFLIYSIEKLTKDSQITIKNSQSNKGIISKVFYDLIYQISSCYSQFYQQLARNHPKIDLIVEYGTTIRIKIDKLKTAYSDLLKSKLINFKMIELYMQFLTNFVGENAFDTDDIGRLMKAQKNIYFQDISQNYLPTISLYLQTGSIENANSQAQKLLHSTRFQLKYKNILAITYPSLTIQKLKQFVGQEPVDAKDDPIYSFFRQSDEEYSFASINFEQRVLRQKKLMVMQMTRLKFSDQKNYFLVSKDFDFKLMIHKIVKVKNGGFRARPLIMNWQELFQKYILTNQQKIVNSKMVKIPTVENQCIMVVKRLRCLVEDYMILQAQIFVTSQLIRKNRSQIFSFRRSFEQKKYKLDFQFQVSSSEDNQKLSFYGFKSNTNTQSYFMDKKINLPPQCKRIQNQLVAAIIEQRNRDYGNNIKTYRLFDGDLYNVDLQDRQAYNNLFQQHITQSKRIEMTDNTSLECYIFVAVVLLGFILVGLSVVLIVQFNSTSSTIKTQYSQFINIQSLIIDFTRILCILRDHASGFIKKFPSFNVDYQIKQSYSRIQKLKNQIMFSNSEYSIQFQQFVITGSLIELIDVILAHVTEVLNSRDLSVIEDIHNTCFSQLNDMIFNAQSDIYGEVMDQINYIKSLSNNILFSSLGIVVILYFLMVFYCFKSNSQLQKSLSSLLFISDNEAHMHQQNAEKMKYAVEMIRKNFEIDSQNLLNSDTDYKKRKNPKQPIQSKQIVYSIAAMAIIGLAVHLSCLFFFQSQFNTQLSIYQTMKDQSISTTTVYHTSLSLTNFIDHIGYVNTTMLTQIRGNLSYLQNNLNNLVFLPQISQFIIMLYFSNSCPMLTTRFNMTARNCSIAAPGFTINNPFQIGMALYLNRQNYYFYNNLTQDFAHSGVYSGPFAMILTNLTQMYKGEGQRMMDDILKLVNLFNGCKIVIDLGYILAFIMIYYFFRNQFIKIKEILLFFDEKFKSKKIVNEEEKEEIELKSEQSIDESSEEENLMRRQQVQVKSHQSVVSNYKKRLSIQLKKPLNIQQQKAK